MTIALLAAAQVRMVTWHQPSQRFVCGTGGVTAGAVVGQGTDGIVMTDGSTGNVLPPIGIALQTGLITETVDVAMPGSKVSCLTGATAGSEVYPVDGTPGGVSHTPSTKKYSIGPAIAAGILLVRPMYVA